jgi:O-antigen/teichoic acid export membrane protein
MREVTDIAQGSLFGKLSRHGTIYFVSNATMRFVHFLLIPMDTHFFNPDDYGVIVTVISSTKILTVFVGLYLDAAYARFYHEYKHDPVLLRQYTSTIYWFSVGWGALVTAVSLAIVGLIVRPGIPIWPILFLAFLDPWFTQLGMLSQSYLQQNLRSTLQVCVALFTLALNVGVMLLLVGVFHVGIVGKFMGIACGSGLLFILGAFILSHDGYLHFTFSPAMLIQSLRYAVPLLPNLAAGWITTFSDRILLTWHGSTAETGVYNVGYSLGMGFTLFSLSIFQVYGPVFFARMRQNKELAQQQMERFIPYYFMLMLWLCLAFSLFAREMVAILTPGSYLGAATVLPVVLLAYFLGSQYQPALAILAFEKKTGLISAAAIIQALVNLSLNLILIPSFGKTAAAWTTVAAISAYTAWMVFWAHRLFRLRMDLQRMGLAALIGGAAILLYWIFAMSAPASQLLAIPFKSGLLMMVPLGLWFLGGIRPADKALFKERGRVLIMRRVKRVV